MRKIRIINNINKMIQKTKEDGKMEKLLLFCEKSTKQNYVLDFRKEPEFGQFVLEPYEKDKKVPEELIVNGYVVGECEYKVEEIRYVEYNDEWGYETDSLNEDDIQQKACISGKQLFDSLQHLKKGSAYVIQLIHVKIYTDPKTVVQYSNRMGPMQYIYTSDGQNIPLVILPTVEAVRVFNGKQTAIIRKHVLRGMK